MDTCQIQMVMLVINKWYVRRCGDVSLMIEGVFFDDVANVVHVLAHWMGDLATELLPTVRPGILIRQSAKGCMFEGDESRSSVSIRLHDPECAAIAPRDISPQTKDLLFDYIENKVKEEQVFDTVWIEEDQMASDLTREGLLNWITYEWRGDRDYTACHENMEEVGASVANNGHLCFRTAVCVSGMDEEMRTAFSNMASRVAFELSVCVNNHPDWFNASFGGPTVQSLQAEGRFEGIEAPFEIMPLPCITLDDLPIYVGPAEMYVIATDREHPEGWLVPPVVVPGGFAAHSLVMSLPLGSSMVTSLVRFLPASPRDHMIYAVEDLAKAYVFPELIAMNDLADMSSVLGFGTCLYSMFEFDLRWGGITSVDVELREALKGKQHVFCVLSTGLDLGSDSLKRTLNTLVEICSASMDDGGQLLISCSLNRLPGQRTVRLSIYARLAEGE